MIFNISRQEVLISLYGAWRLLLRDTRGLELMDDSIDGYWKSFFCAVVVLPGYCILVAVAIFGAGLEAGLFRIIIVEGIGYVIAWVAWPFLMTFIAAAFDRDRNYIRYIVAYNWSAGISVGIFLIVVAIQQTGMAPEGIMTLISFVARIAVLTYHWFILRVALEVTPGSAAALVAGDFVLALIINGVSIGMLK